MTITMNEAVETRQTRSKRKVRFEEPVADVRPRPRREAAASKPVVAEDPAVPSEMEVRVACSSALWAHQPTHTFMRTSCLRASDIDARVRRRHSVRVCVCVCRRRAI